jgi:hypothetical protein
MRTEHGHDNPYRRVDSEAPFRARLKVRMTAAQTQMTCCCCCTEARKGPRASGLRPHTPVTG